ncbi:MAG: glycosyltransferase [Moheibacter sp.]
MAELRIISSVINNYQGDQRVQKQIRSFRKFGFETEVIATDLRGNPKLDFDYPVQIIRLSNQDGMLMYLEFNRKLFGRLMKSVKKGDILLANDLDSLLPNYLISKIKKVPVVFDSHEIFSELPSLTGRKFKKKSWKMLESSLVPRLKHFYTVSEGYADWFEKEYGNRPEIIMNVPEIQTENNNRLQIELPQTKENQKILIYQGAINISRGIDKMILAMEKIESAQLWIIGNGPKKEEYQKLTSEKGLDSKVIFISAVPPDQLKLITPKADLGFSLEEDLGISYRYALPNKIFDYMHAGVPVLGTDLPDIKRTIENYKIGRTVSDHTPEQIAKTANEMLAEGKEIYSENLRKATPVFNWSNEEKKLEKIFSEFITQIRPEKEILSR